MIKITSLSNDKVGIALPQMTFESRVDDVIDFNVVRLTEKVLWQALENSGVDYVDWIAYKNPGHQVLNLFVEPANGSHMNEKDLAERIRNYIADVDDSEFKASALVKDTSEMVGFDIKVTFLKKGVFADFTVSRQAEGADLAHLKPPHINPSDKILSSLLGEPEEIIVVTRTGEKSETPPKPTQIATKP
jgi:hypothetical protein